MKILKKITTTIDSTVGFAAKTFSAVLIVPLIFATVYDVTLRYIFNSATEWAYDVTWMSYAMFFLIGLPYCQQKNANVMLDFFVGRIPARKRAVVECCYLMVFVFPIVLVILYYSIPYAWQAWMTGDRSQYTMWRPYLAPVKSLLPISFGLLLFQGISIFIKKISYAIKGVEL